MNSNKSPQTKNQLHIRNRHRNKYNFDLLTKNYQKLSKFVFTNKYKTKTIDFANPSAVKALNTALLRYFYNITFWDIPNNYLCPPIPGRADYIHYVADILSKSNNNKIPKGSKIRCLDIGVGANLIYPLIGNFEYGWSFVGTDINKLALKNAQKIINKNDIKKNIIELRLQKNAKKIFSDIINPKEHFDITICNPPFYKSQQKAHKETSRKVSNLSGTKQTNPTLNFGGNNNELWCNGGELIFITNMIKESLLYKSNCTWFTSLVAKQIHLPPIYKVLKKINVTHVQTIEMAQGNKKSRIIAWSFSEH